MARRGFEPAVAERLREQARRQITPEEAADELGVCHRTFISYLTAAGGRLASRRYFVLPNESDHDPTERASPAASTRAAR